MGAKVQLPNEVIVHIASFLVSYSRPNGELLRSSIADLCNARLAYRCLAVSRLVNEALFYHIVLRISSPNVTRLTRTYASIAPYVRHVTAEPSRVSLALTRKEYVDLLTDSAECNGRSFVKVFEDGIYVCSKEQECTGYHGVPGQPPPETIFLRKWMRPLYIHQGHEGGACIFEWQLHLSNIQIELGFESYKQQALDEDAIAPILELAWTKAFASWHNLQRVDLVRTWDEGGEYADSSRLSDIPGCRNLALSSYHQYSYGDLRLMRLFFLAMARSGAKLKELSLSADVTTLEELTVGADITPEPEPSPMLDNMRCTLAHLRYLQFAQEPLVENYQPWDPFVLELFGTIFEDCHSSLCGLEYRFSGYRDELKPVPLPSGLTFPCLRELSFESPPIGEHLCIDHVKLISNLVDNMPELRMLKLDACVPIMHMRPISVLPTDPIRGRALWWPSGT